MAEIKEAKLSDLVFDDKNFNKHTEYGMSLIEKSIRNNGAGRSILIDKNNRIIAGTGVTEIAGQIGLDDVQIVETDGTKIIAVKRTDIDLDSKQGREMALADNATAAVDLEWDEEQIQFAEEEFGFVAEEWGVDIDTKEQPTATEDDFDESTDAITTRCKKGDIWLLGEHRLMCGDSTIADDVAKLMDGCKADLWLTDPPYNVDYVSSKNRTSILTSSKKLKHQEIKNDRMNYAEYEEFLKKCFAVASNNLKNGGSFYVWFSSSFHTLVEKSLTECDLIVKQELIWNKNSLVLGWNDYKQKHEPCFYGWKNGEQHYFINVNNCTTVMDFDRPLCNKYHPTMKPVELFAYQITNSSRDGDKVLDTFGGSGTTLIACEQLNRKCYMMELDPHYCDVIIARWEKLTGKNARRMDDGL